MSIEQTLERIAVGIEKLIELQGGATPAPTPNISNVNAPMPGPSGTGPGQALPGPAPGAMTGAAPPPPPAVGGPPVGGPPQLAAVPAPAPGPQAAPAPGPQAAPAPGAPPAPAPVADTRLLDQIRDAANSFHRAHPERAGEVWQILSAVGAQKIDAIPAQSQQQVLGQIQALGA